MKNGRTNWFSNSKAMVVSAREEVNRLSGTMKRWKRLLFAAAELALAVFTSARQVVPLAVEVSWSLNGKLVLSIIESPLAATKICF
jgi:hypothetical protein